MAEPISEDLAAFIRGWDPARTQDMKIVPISPGAPHPAGPDFALTSLDAEIAVAREVLTKSPAGTHLVFGAPTRCPRCADFGYVDAVIEDVGATFNQCFRCERRWTITKRAIDAVGSFQSEAPQPSRRGVLLERLERARTDRANAPAPSVRFVSA